MRGRSNPRAGTLATLVSVERAAHTHVHIPPLIMPLILIVIEIKVINAVILGIKAVDGSQPSLYEAAEAGGGRGQSQRRGRELVAQAEEGGGRGVAPTGRVPCVDGRVEAEVAQRPEGARAALLPGRKACPARSSVSAASAAGHK